MEIPGPIQTTGLAQTTSSKQNDVIGEHKDGHEDSADDAMAVDEASHEQPPTNATTPRTPKPAVGTFD